jgi:hypothetical protein
MTFGRTKADCGYQVRKTERKRSQFYTDHVKLLIRNGDDLEKDIKIVKAFGKDIKLNFCIKNCTNVS